MHAQYPCVVQAQSPPPTRVSTYPSFADSARARARERERERERLTGETGERLRVFVLRGLGEAGREEKSEEVVRREEGDEERRKGDEEREGGSVCVCA